MASSALAPKSSRGGCPLLRRQLLVCHLGGNLELPANFAWKFLRIRRGVDDIQDQSQDKAFRRAFSRAGIERAREQSYLVFPPTREREVAWERFKDGKPPRTPFPPPTRVFVSTSLSNPTTTEHPALRARDRSQEGTLSRGIEARWTP